jgi:DNA-binding CsgD family transcriptional regulator
MLQSGGLRRSIRGARIRYVNLMLAPQACLLALPISERPRTICREGRMQAQVLALLPVLERAGLGVAISHSDGSIAARNGLFEAVLARLGAAYRQGLPLRLPQRLRLALDRNPGTPVFLDSRKPKSILGQRFADGNALSIVVLVDLRQRPEPHASTLQRCFALTPCEARLASALASGLRLRDIAERYGVEVGTIRAQLKTVFLKTGTQRQSELVSLLARLPLFSDVG